MFRFAPVVLFLYATAPVRSRPVVNEAEFKAERVKRSDDPSPLQNVVDAMSQKVLALEAKVAALQNTQTTVDSLSHSVSTLQASVATLQQKIGTIETKVAFHALSSSTDITTVARGTIIVPRVLTNIGNAYAAHSGFFTAPVSGLYVFHAKIMNADSNDKINAGIYVGSTQVAVSTSDQRHGYWDNPSMFAIVHVNKGQLVQLKSNNAEVDHLYHGEYTSFSGLLIRAD